MIATEIDQRPIGRMYRVANILARITDLIRIPLVLFLLFASSFMVAAWPMKWVYTLLTSLGFPEGDLPSGYYTDMTNLALESVTRVAMVAVPLLYLSIRDFGLFPIRTKSSLIFSIVLSAPFVLWLYSAVKNVPSSDSSLAINMGEALMLPVTIVDDLFVGLTPGPYVAPFHFAVILLVLVVILSSFVYLLSVIITTIGQSTGRTIIIGKRHQYPSIIRQLISTLGRILARQKLRLIGAVVMLLVASFVGSLIILANRITFFSMDPFIFKGVQWLASNGVNLGDQELQFLYSGPNIVLAPFLMALLTLFFSLKFYSGRWHLFLPVLFLAIHFPLLYLARLLPSNFFIIYLFYSNILAFIAVTPFVLKALSEIRYVLLISRINVIKKLQSDSENNNLFLRPFALDKSDIVSSFGLRLPFLGWLKRRVRLEEVISRSAFLFGPLMAVGDPSDQRAGLGAIREYFTELDDTRWQQYIKDSIQNAQHIFFIIDHSEFTVWETEQILEYGVTHKLILVLPDKRGAASSYFRSNPAITKSLGLTHEQIASIDRNGVLAIAPGEKGCTLIRGCGRRAPDYLMAIDRAVTI